MKNHSGTIIYWLYLMIFQLRMNKESYMRSFIFANGQMVKTPEIIKNIQQEDLIIAADGGLRFCTQLGITPHMIVGDLDSVNPDQLGAMKTKGIQIVKYPVHKDQTDLELALQTAIKKGAHIIYILGALGARWDMTFSSALILAADFLNDVNVKILDGEVEVFCMKGNGHSIIENRMGKTLSLLPLTHSVDGITLDGVQYPLNNESLYIGETRGLSNVIIHKTASIRIENGILLVFLDASTN